MKQHLLLAGMAATLALAVPGDRAHAEYFEFSTTVSVSPITGISSTSNNGSTNVVMTTNGGDSISLTALASGGGGHNNAGGDGTDIRFGEIGVGVTASTTYQVISFGFTYSLTLTDYSAATGGSALGQGTIQVSGLLGDSIGSGKASNLNDLKNYATNPANGVIFVGSVSYAYILTPNSYTPPGPDHTGAFGGHVSVGLVSVPEPGAWASLSIGLTGVAGLFFRQRLRRNLA
jgi:hypothetical protein